MDRLAARAAEWGVETSYSDARGTRRKVPKHALRRLLANLDSHNVKLKKGPRKVDKKDFKSATGTIGIKFTPKFKVPGKYHFICTLHSSVMQMDVIVKK